MVTDFGVRCVTCEWTGTVSETTWDPAVTNKCPNPQCTKSRLILNVPTDNKPSYIRTEGKPPPKHKDMRVRSPEEKAEELARTRRAVYSAMGWNYDEYLDAHPEDEDL
jgi:hypothetical protein